MALVGFGFSRVVMFELYKKWLKLVSKLNILLFLSTIETATETKKNLKKMGPGAICLLYIVTYDISTHANIFNAHTLLSSHTCVDNISYLT